MVQYITKRLALTVPLVMGLVILTFAYVRLIPGDPVVSMLGVNSDPELVARTRAELGLDEPFVTQFFVWLQDVSAGDLGVSFRSRVPVAEIIGNHVVPTVQLAAAALVVGLLAAIPAGIAAGMKPGSRIDRMVTATTLVGLALPSFWIGSLFILVLSVRLGWLPSQGYTPFWDDATSNMQKLVIPAMTLGIAISPYLARLTRSLVIGTRDEAFVMFARSQGLGERQIQFRIIFRNVLPSLAIAIALTAGFLLAGSIIVEELFNWPGIGVLISPAVTERDYAMLQALILIYGLAFILINLLAEVIQGLLDPRIRLR